MGELADYSDTDIALLLTKEERKNDKSTVSTKRNAKFLMTFFGVKIINCKNDSISVVLPFNQELCSKVL